MYKMFTAVATLQLVEAGKLALDDTVLEHLPDYPNRDFARTVTVRHLLTHTGGAGDIFGAEFARRRLELREHADYVALYGSRAAEFPPGVQWRYSNFGYVLLGALIEQASGMSYHDYVDRHVFRPAGMRDSGSQPESTAVARRAVGYTVEGGAVRSNADTLPWRGTAAGGGYSTARDLLRFANALQDGRLLSPAMRAEATRDHGNGYGYGFVVAGHGPSVSHGHNGGAPGMNGSLRAMPQSGYVVVALANVDPPHAERLADHIVARLPLRSPDGVD
jgi:D-alanyl-D-alanine carboxypeptidase